MAERPKPAALEITISNRQKAVHIPAARLRRLIRFVAGAEARPIASIDLAIVTAGQIQELNRHYLDRDEITDVLSFDLSDESPPGISAQIVVCGDVAAKQGPPRGHSAERELMLYVVHGLLHLMGYEDSTARGAARMHAREDELLSEIGEGPAYSRRPKGGRAERKSGKGRGRQKTA